MKSSTKYLKILTNYLLMALSLFAVFYLLPKAIVFFAPFVIAAIIALMANPIVRFLEKHIKIKRKAGSAIFIILIIGIVVFASYLVISLIASEMSGLAQSLPAIWRTISNTFKGLNDDFARYTNRMPEGVRNWLDSVSEGISDSLSAWVSGFGERTAAAASETLKNIPLTLICIVMCILASYLFVAEREYIEEKCNLIFGEGAKKRWALVRSTLRDAVGGYFRAQFKIELFVYIILFVGLLILRIRYAFLIALIIAFLDLLPFFGAGAIMWPWAAIAAMQKDFKTAIGIMIVWAVGQIVRQFIQPKFVGDSVGVEPIPTLILLFIGFRLGGALGLIIAIPAGMILINLYRAGLFSNFVYSTQILIKDLSNFRRFSDDELEQEGIKKNRPDIDEDTNENVAGCKDKNKNENGD